MIVNFIPGNTRRSRRLLLAGALFLFLLIAGACGRPQGETEMVQLTAAEKAWLKAHPVIRLAPDPNFPPVEFFSKSGAYSGISADYIRLVEKRLGIRLKIIRLRNWADVIDKAKRREVDILIATDTPQRAEYLLFTKPFLKLPIVIITRKKFTRPLTLDDLAGMKVSVVSGYATNDLIVGAKPKFTLDIVPDVRAGLRRLSFARSDAFVENLATASHYIEQEGISNLRISGETEFSYRMGFCTRSDWPELHHILEKALASISPREQKSIYKKWIPLEYRSLFFSRDFQKGLIAAFTLILLIAAAVVAWNRTLARQVRLRTRELEDELSQRRLMEEELRQARGELENRVVERTVDLQRTNELLEREIDVRSRTESVNMARLRLLQYASSHSLDELLEATLNEAELLTGSLIGFYVFVDDDQRTMMLQNWSTRTKREFCKAEWKGFHYDISQAGVWADCIRQRRPVIHNDYASLTHRKGLPPDHAPLIREVVVPVLRGSKIVAVLAVGNKPSDYTPQDVEAVSQLADLAWEIAVHKKMEDELKLSHFCINNAAIGIYQTTAEGDILSANAFACRSLGYSTDELCSLKVPDIDPGISAEMVQEITRALEISGVVTHESIHRRKDGSTFPVEIVTSHLEYQGKSYSFSFVKDITKRQWTERVIMARLRLHQYAVSCSLDELLEATLNEAEELTGSQIGFYHFLEPDQRTLTLQNWSTRTKSEFCTATGKGIHYDIDDAGVWADCIRQRRPLIHNDYSSLPLRKGLPPGHAAVTRELVVPVLRGDNIVAVLGVGNKPVEYAPEDVEAVSLLADLAWDITERKRIEEALRQANMVVENSPVVLFRCKPVPGWPVELVSRNVVQFGYQPEEFLSGERDYASIIHPQDLEWVTNETEEYSATAQGQLRQEYRILTKGGEVRWIIDETNCVWNDQNEISRFEGVIIDVTERKLAEEALREANLVVEHSPVVLFRWRNTNGWPVELVSTNIVQFGYDPDEFLSDAINYSSLIHPDDLKRVYREVHEYCERGVNQFRLEYRIITKCGEVRWVNEHSNVERDTVGETRHFEGVIIDVTERRLAEDSIRESKAKYQAIVDSFDGLIYICSPDHRIEFMNRKLIERTGRDAVGELCYQVLHDRDAPCPWCLNERIFKGETLHGELLSPKDDRWYYMLNVPIHHADGSMSKHSMLVDITDRKLFEEELQRQKRMLQELNETLERRVAEEVRKSREKDIAMIQQNRQAALGEMLDHIAHQWKQPLNSISLIIQEMELTAADGELTDQHVQSTVDTVMSILDHMAQTVDTFRDFFRPDKEKRGFSIGESIDQVIAFTTPAFKVMSIAVERDVDPELTAYGYPKEYAQALLNILANARDVFRSRKTSQPRVVMKGYTEGERSVVTITDNGGGIPEKIIGRIFDFSFTTKEASGGSGIGLYMSKNIIEQHMGGTLSAENVPGGARFRIQIPSSPPPRKERQ